MPLGGGLFGWIETTTIPRSLLEQPTNLTLTALGQSAQDAFFKSVSGLQYESELYDACIVKIDSFALKQTISSDAITLQGLVLFSFEPQGDFTFVKAGNDYARSAGISGRIVLNGGTRAIAAWRFERGLPFAIGSIRLGLPGTVLLVPESLRRG